MSSYC